MTSASRKAQLMSSHLNIHNLWKVKGTSVSCLTFKDRQTLSIRGTKKSSTIKPSLTWKRKIWKSKFIRKPSWTKGWRNRLKRKVRRQVSILTKIKTQTIAKISKARLINLVQVTTIWYKKGQSKNTQKAAWNITTWLPQRCWNKTLP